MAPGYIIVWHPPASCGHMHLYRIQPVHRSRWYSDIFDQMHLFLDWRLSWGSTCYTSKGYATYSIESIGCLNIHGIHVTADNSTNNNVVFFFVSDNKVKLVTLVKGDLKAPFSTATTPRCRGRRPSIPRIAPLYPWSSPYSAEC